MKCNVMFGHSQGRCAADCAAKCEVDHAMHQHWGLNNLHCSRLHARAPLWRQARGTRRSHRAASAVPAESAQVPRPEASCAARRQMLQIAAIGTIVLPLYPAYPASAASDGSRFITSSSGLKIEDIREGTGTTPAPGACLPCNAMTDKTASSRYNSRSRVPFCRRHGVRALGRSHDRVSGKWLPVAGVRALGRSHYRV